MVDSYLELNLIFEELKVLSVSELISIDSGKINRIIRKYANKIYIVPMVTYRIGHLALNTEDFLRYHYHHLEEYKARKELVVLVDNNFIGEVSNLQLFEMVKRRIPVINRTFFAVIIELAKNDPDLWSIDNSPLFYSWLRNTSEFFNAPPQLWFTPEEETKGRRLLQDMGIEPDKPFVCFHNRDSAYLDYLNSKVDWSYHDYRDSDIENYLPAINYLVQQGYYCIRMGQKVSKSIEFGSSKIIDYASEYRSDFGDIYLSAKCSLFLGSGTGISHVSTIFNKPCLMTNMIPVVFSPNPVVIPSGFENILPVIYKKCWYSEEKRFLTFKELLVSQMHNWGNHTENYRKLGIEVVQNSPEEILDFTIEMHRRISGTWVETQDDIELLDKFYRLFSNNKGECCFPYTRVGSTFIKKNSFLLE
ncbi:MAG: TIGR04372 family glycosyltransferase [Clostridia bacterium]|nr:TIGR04372 family glycosyltransferase [Clostridia bacterium]